MGGRSLNLPHPSTSGLIALSRFGLPSSTLRMFSAVTRAIPATDTVNLGMFGAHEWYSADVVRYLDSSARWKTASSGLLSAEMMFSATFSMSF